ncbi:LysM peptidoglycan-binding domain-containing protein [Microbacterium sp.]|uniref:LysM peptidoglycan-binding domain-containing protein n=1 Tax=Microbacterium sp. TaxID=51671 RepID=UPI0032219B66
MTTIDVAGVYRPARVRVHAPATTRAPASARARTTRLRLTVRGRRALAAVASVPAVVGLSLAIVSGGGALASDAPAAPAVEFATVSVQPGDSLWTIAETIAPEADPRDVVDGIMRLNGLTSSALDVGQSLAIPREFATPAGAASGD